MKISKWIRKTAMPGVLAVSCALSSPISAAADTLSRIRQNQTVTIAYREASFPFSYLDENKKPIGYSMDICLRLVDALKRELKLPQLNVKYLLVSSSTRIPAIAEGKADLECGSTTNNAERRSQVSFSISHFFATVRMIVRTDSGIRNWQDLKDKKIVTTKGTTTVKLLTERDKVRALGLKLIEGNDHNDSFKMVENFQVDAFPMDDVLLYGLRANAADPSKFSIVGDALSTEAYGIMLARDDPNFKTLVDKEMARLMIDGEIGKLYDKWFNRAVPPKNANLNMPMNRLLRENIRFPSE